MLKNGAYKKDLVIFISTPAFDDLIAFWDLDTRPPRKQQTEHTPTYDGMKILISNILDRDQVVVGIVRNYLP